MRNTSVASNAYAFLKIMPLKAFFLCAALLGWGGLAASAQGDPGAREALNRFFLPSSTVRRGFLGVDEYFLKMTASQEESGGLVYESGELGSPLDPAFDDPTVMRAKSAFSEHEYRKAHQMLLLHLVPRAASKDVAQLVDRLVAVQYFYPTLDVGRGQWAQALGLGLHDFLRGRDRHAVLRVSYALSLNPVAPKLADFLERLEAITRIKGERIATGTGLSLLETKLNASETAFKAGRYDEMMRLTRDVLVLWPEHATALSRLGSGFYLQGKLPEAKAVWKQALRLEGRRGVDESRFEDISRLGRQRAQDCASRLKDHLQIRQQWEHPSD